MSAFKKLENKLAKKPGVFGPGGLAAAIGRKKFGAKKFQAKATAGAAKKAAKMSSYK